MTDFQSATAVPVFMQEEGGELNAYIGIQGTENVALLASVRVEAMNMVQPPSAALDAFRSLVRLLGAAVQGEVRAQVTRGLLNDGLDAEFEAYAKQRDAEAAELSDTKGPTQ